MQCHYEQEFTFISAIKVQLYDALFTRNHWRLVFVYIPKEKQEVKAKDQKGTKLQFF